MKRDPGDFRDSIMLDNQIFMATGRPAVVLRAIVDALRVEMATNEFPATMDDWECALADVLTATMRQKGGFEDSRSGKPSKTAWGQQVFRG